MADMRSMLGHPFGAHTLEEGIEQVGILAERTPKTMNVDRDYVGAELEGIRIHRSGPKRGISRTMHAMIKRLRPNRTNNRTREDRRATRARPT